MHANFFSFSAISLDSREKLNHIEITKTEASSFFSVSMVPL